MGMWKRMLDGDTANDPFQACDPLGPPGTPWDPLGPLGTGRGLGPLGPLGPVCPLWPPGNAPGPERSPGPPGTL
eukprot:4538721-Prymnesium_polylepis.1